MEKRIIEPIPVYTTRLVKSEDLNHHGTLFAGRTAEWFVESGFVSVATLLNPSQVVCLKIHGMFFTKPALPGEILKFTSKVIHTGKTSLISYIEVFKNNSEFCFVNGFITFVFVDAREKSTPHGIEILAVTDEDIKLQEEAIKLKKS
jgi:acyl-CoA hydrolase